jgi:hypothetical protein
MSPLRALSPFCFNIALHNLCLIIVQKQQGVTSYKEALRANLLNAGTADKQKG